MAETAITKGGGARAAPPQDGQGAAAVLEDRLRSIPQELASRFPALPGVGMDLLTLGAMMADSGFFEDARTAAQAIAKILAGQEIGVGPFRAMAEVRIIKGKATLSATLIASLIKRSGRYDYRVLRLDEGGCELEFLERRGEGWVALGRSAFTIEDAKRAHLTERNPTWFTFPRNMVFARALTNGARWYTGDVFGGPIYTAEELEDVPDAGELPPATAPQAPAPAAGSGSGQPEVLSGPPPTLAAIEAYARDYGKGPTWVGALARGTFRKAATELAPEELAQLEALVRRHVGGNGGGKPAAVAQGSPAPESPGVGPTPGKAGPAEGAPAGAGEKSEGQAAPMEPHPSGRLRDEPDADPSKEDQATRAAREATMARVYKAAEEAKMTAEDWRSYGRMVYGKDPERMPVDMLALLAGRIERIAAGEGLGGPLPEVKK